MLDPPTQLGGRAELLATLEQRLADGVSVLLTGAEGIGKSAVLEALASSAQERGELVLRAAGAETERWVAYSALADLLQQLPRHLVDDLPATEGEVVRRIRSGGRPEGESELALCREGWRALLVRCTDVAPVLMVLDDAQWLDAATTAVLAHAARRLGQRPVRAVVAGRSLDRGGDPAPLVPIAALAPPRAVQHVVPPLTADQLAELFEEYELDARTASGIHVDSAGNPFLALALAGAFADRDHRFRRPDPLSPSVFRLVEQRLAALPERVRESLLLCALASRPSVRLLLRAGRQEAQRDVALAGQAGLVVSDGENVRFTPAAAAGVIAELATADRRAAVHLRLAGVVTSTAERDRHLALASADPDDQIARSLVVAGESAQRQGARDLAAELYLLAADRSSAALHTQRLDWLVTAAELGATANRPEVVHRATGDVLAAASTPAQRVRVRLALVHLAGQAVGLMEEVFAAARVDAADDPESLALLNLWLAWAAVMSGRADEADARATDAIGHARDAGDTSTEAMAWAVTAQVARGRGSADHLTALRTGLALPHPADSGRLHLTPRFTAARFAICDDRLEEARTTLLGMLALVERGTADEFLAVLRNLSEVSARLGRCAEALTYAQRAVEVSGEAGLSPGPAWYTAALAELAGGSVRRAATYAERGVRACEQEGDVVFLRRHLHALGQAQLRSGTATAGVATLRRLQEIERVRGIDDPTVLRWHAHLAAGLVAVRDFDEARRTIDATRARLDGRPPSAAVGAQLDRAEAMLLGARGHIEAAVDRLAAAEKVFDGLGQPLEQGHCLLVQGQLDRRRRRYSTARITVSRAKSIFTAARAAPWIEQADRMLARLDAPTERPDPVVTRPEVRAVHPDLTATEGRIASLACDGASNREIADRLYLSVKTVEATLTRIYRKVGVRSRTQLSRRLSS